MSKAKRKRGDTEQTRPTHSAVRQCMADSVGGVRLYGVPLKKPEIDGTVVIWFCGYQTSQQEVRAGSDRLIHIPELSIVSHGITDDFEYRGFKVEWFDIQAQTTLIEESYTSFNTDLFFDSLSQRLHIEGRSPSLQTL